MYLEHQQHIECVFLRSVQYGRCLVENWILDHLPNSYWRRHWEDDLGCKMGVAYIIISSMASSIAYRACKTQHWWWVEVETHRSHQDFVLGEAEEVVQSRAEMREMMLSLVDRPIRKGAERWRMAELRGWV